MAQVEVFLRQTNANGQFYSGIKFGPLDPWAWDMVTALMQNMRRRSWSSNNADDKCTQCSKNKEMHLHESSRVRALDEEVVQIEAERKSRSTL